MKMMSVIAVTPKEGKIDEITNLILQSREDVEGLNVYSIVHTRGAAAGNKRVELKMHSWTT